MVETHVTYGENGGNTHVTFYTLHEMQGFEMQGFPNSNFSRNCSFAQSRISAFRQLPAIPLASPRAVPGEGVTRVVRGRGVTGKLRGGGGGGGRGWIWVRTLGAHRYQSLSETVPSWSNKPLDLAFLFATMWSSQGCDRKPQPEPSPRLLAHSRRPTFFPVARGCFAPGPRLLEDQAWMRI